MGAEQASWDDSRPDKIQIAAPPERHGAVRFGVGRGPAVRKRSRIRIKGYDGYLGGRLSLRDDYIGIVPQRSLS